MRMRRVQFTIGRFMVLVLLSGLVFWSEVLSRFLPSAKEQEALVRYRRTVLNREVAEYALGEYQQSIHPQIVAAAATNPPVATAQDETDLDLRTQERQARLKADHDRQINSLKADIATARANEASQQALYQQERAKRRGIFGF